jgi:hypothetical protein
MLTVRRRLEAPLEALRRGGMAGGLPLVNFGRGMGGFRVAYRWLIRMVV